MLKDDFAGNNRITVTGKILTEPVFSHEIFGEGFYAFDIEAKRLSDAADVLPVTISERIIDPSVITPDVTIAITGQIRSYNSYSERDGKSRLVLTIFARDYVKADAPPEAEPAAEPLETASGGEDGAETGAYNARPRFKRGSCPNDVFLGGYICKPPIYRTTPFGREIADLLIAVNRSYNKSDYIPCIAWGRNARFSGKLTVGAKIRVWGRMQSRAYQKKLEDGSVLDKTAFEVSISKMENGE